MNRIKRGLLLAGIGLAGAVVLVSGYVAVKAALVMADCFAAYDDEDAV